MWKLKGRDNNIRQWAELGEFQSINDAARRVLELEGNRLGSLFFRVYVDPPFAKSDAEILCRLEYQTEKGFYLLQRAVQ
jgi:16S rRNA G966 N2-methylase RsmD